MDYGLERPVTGDAGARPRPSTVRWVGGALILMVLGLAAIGTIDRSTALAVHAMGDTLLIRLSKSVTNVAEGIWPLLITAGAAVVFGFVLKDRLNAKRSLFIFACVAVSGLAVDLAKVILGRERPKLLFQHNEFGFTFLKFRADHWSFPSGHATTSAAVAAGLAILFPRHAPLFFALGMAVAVTRLLAGAHYPGDVLFGFGFGTLTVWWLHRWCDSRGIKLHHR